jgi:DNA-binding transcriptional LysR family regulator
MRDLNDLFYFVQVVDAQGFAPAGRKLDIPKSTLSRRIALLEESLGVRLIQRSTRQFTVTDIGQDYYRHCVAMLVEAEAAAQAVERSRAEPRGIIRISCPPGLAAMGVSDTILKYLANHPLVQVDLEITNRRVDVLSEGFDIALRVRFPPLENSELVMKVLGESTQRLVVHPRLAAEHPIDDASPESLAAIASLGIGLPDREHRWSLHHVSGRQVELPYKPRLITSDFDMLHRATLMGLGAAQLPEAMVQQDLLGGHLVEVLPDWRPRSGIIHAVFASRRGLLPSVRALLDQLADDFCALTQAPFNASPANTSSNTAQTP